MQHTTKTPVRPFNNDRMGTFAAFRSVPEPVQQESSAAVALSVRTPPRPTQLTDEETETLLCEMQGQDIAQAHGNLDPERVARLLNLLG